jgi:hypothetical protein
MSPSSSAGASQILSIVDELRLAAHIAFVADNPGRSPVESAIREHRAAGVGGWFQVR